MITGKVFKERGWPEGRIIGLAKQAAEALQAGGMDREAVLSALEQVRARPEAYAADPLLGPLAAECVLRAGRVAGHAADELRPAPLPYGVWGAEHIDQAALAQMDAATRLPVSVTGALMPDAHVGYGLPIGGVLATEGAVIPFAVGVDIACRMRLSIYPVAPDELFRRPSGTSSRREPSAERSEADSSEAARPGGTSSRRARGATALRQDALARALLEWTQFGAGGAWHGRERAEHQVLDDPDWKATRLLGSLQGKAQEQLGTSGSGNHFVEWGICLLSQPDPHLGLEPGEYLALLSHSGSRGVGFKIANTYSKIAEALHPRLDKSVRHLAWLPLDSEDGQEYWLSMELAGRFASANHAVIHRRVAAAAGLKEVAFVENFHNFAWREQIVDPAGGIREVIVHRKGATPAGPGVLGIIPGSMGDAGYVVRGRGVAESLHSAAHGAGRAMSRRAALDSISKAARDRYLHERGVTLLGGGLDEAPQAYKRVETIIAAQADLVEVIGSFTPRIVRMADEPGDT